MGLLVVLGSGLLFCDVADSAYSLFDRERGDSGSTFQADDAGDGSVSDDSLYS